MSRIVLVNPNTDQATTQAMLAIAREAVAPSITIEGWTAAFGASLIVDEAALATASRAVTSLAPTLRAAAPDGIIVSAFGDPGILDLQDLLACPVTGIAEAGMAEAAEGDRAFAVVTTTPDLQCSIAASAARYGYAHLYRGSIVTPGDPRAVMADPGRLRTALLAACETAVRDLGAKALVIGGGPLATVARALAAIVAVPLIEPVPAAARLAVRRMRTGNEP